MAAIQFTDRRATSRLSVESLALARAASIAMSAPSMVGGQPWRWRIDGPALSLHAEPVSVDDPRIMTVNCGIVLHHARTALAADGVAADIRYVPDPAQRALLATVAHRGQVSPGTHEVRLYRAIAARRTDSRPFAAAPVQDATLDRLMDAARRFGVAPRILAGPGRLLGVPVVDDAPETLLGAGEATSAILLTAHAEGLATELGDGQAGAVVTVRVGIPVSHPSAGP